MNDLCDFPGVLVARAGSGRGGNGIFHLVAVNQEGIFNVAVALGRSFALRGVADGRHGCGCDVVVLVVVGMLTVAMNYRGVLDVCGRGIVVVVMSRD